MILSKKHFSPSDKKTQKENRSPLARADLREAAGVPECRGYDVVHHGHDFFGQRSGGFEHESSDQLTTAERQSAPCSHFNRANNS